MENEVLQKLTEQNAKIEAILTSQEKVRKYFLWLLIISIVVVVLPAIGLIFAIPQFLSIYAPGGALGL